MSLRKILIVLIFLNLGFFLYHQAWLQQLINGDNFKREPERLTQQIHPDAITVKTASLSTITTAAQTLSTPPPERQLPPSPKVAKPTETNAATACPTSQNSWAVYMGPYANEALLNKKIAELKRINVKGKQVLQPTRKLGLSLGEYDTENSARTALVQFNKQGVKTAYVVPWGTSHCSGG